MGVVPLGVLVVFMIYRTLARAARGRTPPGTRATAMVADNAVGNALNRTRLLFLWMLFLWMLFLWIFVMVPFRFIRGRSPG